MDLGVKVTILTGVLYESVYAAYGLFWFVDFTEKCANFQTQPGDIVISSSRFPGLQSHTYLLITRSGK